MTSAEGRSGLIDGRVFEDTIDGYFPLSESLRQLLVRQACTAAFIRLLHAPAMEIPGLGANDPVPLTITKGHVCMIHELSVCARLTGESIQLSGIADWVWEPARKDSEFSPHWRLAEPAFVRGVQINDRPARQARPFEDVSKQTLYHLKIQYHFKDSVIVKGKSRVENSVVILRPDQSADQTSIVALNVVLNDDERQRLIAADFLHDHI